MSADCQACGRHPATRRVGFPASPVAQNTFDVCTYCADRVADLDGVTNVPLRERP